MNPSFCPDGQAPILIELSHPCGLQLSLMDWGATWLSCRVPVGKETREVLLGRPSVADHFAQTAYMGATVGRYANRIGHAQFSHDGQVFHLTPTAGGHQLHGGPSGFDKRRWRVLEQGPAHVILGMESAAGDQGFPGNLVASVCYRLEENARVSMEYTATVDAPCPVNLTNHAYFNLDGTTTDIRQHTLQIHAQHYLPTDTALIPLGDLAPVAGSSFDFTQPKLIGRDFLTEPQQIQARGYDHAWLLDPACQEMTTPAATLTSSDKQLIMKLFTNKPAMQFYSGNYLAGVSNRSGGNYAEYQGLALETQFLPDSPNHPEWPQPDCWLHPGQTYQYTTILAFQQG